VGQVKKLDQQVSLKATAFSARDPGTKADSSKSSKSSKNKRRSCSDATGAATAPRNLKAHDSTRNTVEGWGLRIEGWGLRVEGWGLRVEGWGLRVRPGVLGTHACSMRDVAVAAHERWKAADGGWLTWRYVEGEGYGLRRMGGFSLGEDGV
jgi:hypothetical protein